ncbi:MAG: hypothetical protein ACOVSW_12905 [Candidatus Kapaibacteriota bacterium]
MNSIPKIPRFHAFSNNNLGVGDWSLLIGALVIGIIACCLLLVKKEIVGEMRKIV